MRERTLLDFSQLQERVKRCYYARDVKRAMSKYFCISILDLYTEIFLSIYSFDIFAPLFPKVD